MNGQNIYDIFQGSSRAAAKYNNAESVANTIDNNDGFWSSLSKDDVSPRKVNRIGIERVGILVEAGWR